MRDGIPEVLAEYLSYHETIAGHSDKTVDEYFLDLRLFFRFLLKKKRALPAPLPFEEISISAIDIDFIQNVTQSDVYAFLHYLSRERPVQQNSAKTNYGIAATSRARKIVAIRSFYSYLKKFKLIDENPFSDLETPKHARKLPRYLTLDESIALLNAIGGRNATRDFAIIALFLNCGLRRSELSGLNLNDVQGDKIRVLGKGNKERELYLNAACLESINAYLAERPEAPDEAALFLSTQTNNGKYGRMHPNTIHALIKKHIQAAGLDQTRYSSHKLRHTAATLMLKNGVDIRAVQEVLGHEDLNTTQIYTHIDSSEMRLAAEANPLSKIMLKKNAD